MTDTSVEPYGYAFRVYSRKPDATDFGDMTEQEQRYFNRAGVIPRRYGSSVNLKPKSEGDTVEYFNPYADSATGNSIKLGDTMVREGEPAMRPDDWFGRRPEDVPGLSDEDRAAMPHGVTPYKAMMPHRGISMIGITDPMYSLFNVGRTDMLRYGKHTQDEIDAMMRDPNMAIRYAQAPLDDGGMDFDEDGNDGQYVYKLDLGALRQMPDAYFDTRNIPYYNTLSEGNELVGDMLDAMRRRDFNEIRRIFASGDYGRAPETSNRYKSVGYDDISEALNLLYDNYMLTGPTSRYENMTDVGASVASDMAIDNSWFVPRAAVLRDINREANGLPMYKGHSDIARDSLTKYEQNLGNYLMLQRIMTVLRHAGGLKQGTQLSGVPLLVQVPLSELYTKDDVAKGVLRAQRDFPEEIVARSMRPVRELDIGKLRELYDSATSRLRDLGLSDLKRPRDGTSDSTWAAYKQIDDEVASKLRAIAGISDDGPPIISDEEQKYILDDMRREFNKPEFSGLRKLFTERKLNSNIVDALTSGGSAWR